VVYANAYIPLQLFMLLYGKKNAIPYNTYTRTFKIILKDTSQMDNWITVISFIYPHEAHLAKGKLESEGFEVVIKDELTVQVNNFYSNAIGGVKLLVKESDYENALQLLIESGYIKEQIRKPNKVFMQFDKLTSKLPLIGKSIIEFRIIILVALILIILSFLLYFLLLPSTPK
jgi:hypothetical protein